LRVRSCPICRVAMVHTDFGWSCPQCGSAIVDPSKNGAGSERDEPPETTVPAAAAGGLRS
jgi:hypothetical protein